MTAASDVLPSIVVLAGPTASGKSALALELARALDGEIVSADSVQVYRGFDVGSAKPTPSEQAEVPHHLIDIRDSSQTYNAADFVRDAGAAIGAIVARGRVPIVCGGTGLYIRSLVHGLAAAAPADPRVRALLEAEAAEAGIERLHQRLQALDPVAAARIHARDRIRIVRALEIHEVTGRGPTDWFAEHQLAERPYRYAGIALSAPRSVLHARIGARTRSLVAAGLLDEVRGLLAAGVSPTCQGLGAIGYREAMQVLSGELRADELTQTLTASTRQYAKRQLVWLRGQIEGLRWFDLRAVGDALPGLIASLEAWQGGGAFAEGEDSEVAVAARG